MNLDELINKLTKKYEIVAGFPQEKQVVYGPDDRKGRHGKGGETVAEVARQNEFGKKGVFWQDLNGGKGGRIDIPARPFMREALKNNKEEIIDLVKKSFSPRNIDNPTRYAAIGNRMVTMIRDSIRNGNWLPNSPRTIAIKKSDKPLRDIGIMIRSVSSVVRDVT